MKILTVFCIIALLVGVFYWRTAHALEKPKYTLLSKSGRLEIREYEPVMIASTALNGSYDTSTSQGFRIIANYIFGGNQQSQKIAMTAPVLVEDPQTPSYKMAFVMPTEAVIKGLPDPSSSSLVLKEVSWGRVAVWKFGGKATENRIKKEWSDMQKAMELQNLESSSFDWIAQYNPPFIPPPFRRNELWVLLP